MTSLNSKEHCGSDSVVAGKEQNALSECYKSRGAEAKYIMTMGYSQDKMFTAVQISMPRAGHPKLQEYIQFKRRCQ
jgi:hypothetical protein